MSKDLVVKAECVDIRNGKRFFPGDTFKPTPGVDQAQRLVSAGCLPEGAVAAAKAAQAEADKMKAAEDAKAAKLVEARAALAKASAAVTAAQAAFDGTQDAAEKAKTETALEAAKADEGKAKTALEALTR